MLNFDHENTRNLGLDVFTPTHSLPTDINIQCTIFIIWYTSLYISYIIWLHAWRFIHVNAVVYISMIAMIIILITVFTLSIVSRWKVFLWIVHVQTIVIILNILSSFIILLFVDENMKMNNSDQFHNSEIERKRSEYGKTAPWIYQIHVGKNKTLPYLYMFAFQKQFNNCTYYLSHIIHCCEFRATKNYCNWSCCF